MFRATLCPSSGADDLVVFFHVWCSAVTMGSVISIYVVFVGRYVHLFSCFVRWVVVVWWVIVVGGFSCSV